MDLDSDCGFGFAFNNVHFSDRLLRIEITNGGEITNVDPLQDRKRRRKDVNARGLFCLIPNYSMFSWLLRYWWSSGYAGD